MNEEEIVEKLAPGGTIIDVSSFVGGVSALTSLLHFRHASGEEERVVVRRLQGSNQVPDEVGRALREYKLLEALSELGVPAPRPRHFIPPQTLVLDFVAGDTTLPTHAAQPLAIVLAQIHGTPARSLGALPLRIDPLPELQQWLSDSPRVVESIATLTVPQSERRCLLHGDFWPGNVLWRKGNIVAVIDWEDAAIGEPISDLACARLELACAADDEIAEEFTTAYFNNSDANPEALPIWDLYVASAALRFMDQWGLAPAALAHRKSVTLTWQERALTKLGLEF